jgi:hypothetical protein
MKKHVELDAQGQPFGSMKVVLCSDIKKYAKDLDPTTDGKANHGMRENDYSSVCIHVRSAIFFAMHVFYAIGEDMCRDIQPSLETSTTTSMCLYFYFPFCVGIHEQLLLAKMSFWW